MVRVRISKNFCLKLDHIRASLLHLRIYTTGAAATGSLDTESERLLSRSYIDYWREGNSPSTAAG